MQKERVGFFSALVLFFKNYVNFTGRSTRAEYWWMFLWQVIYGVLLWGSIAGLGIMILQKSADNESATAYIGLAVVLGIVALVLALAVIIPSISLRVRRYRDAGVNPLLVLIPYILPNAVTFFLHIPNTDSSATFNAWLASSGMQIGLLLLISFAAWLFNLVITLMPSKPSRNID
ncbi:DUF805 domain-containing protein [Lacticaseibacillus hulanensis]|uniref:DUF805 domain-containing protein n=1 Tax=Lacticaseibacillus hulanensis TaxID=2493111 RepID=UPI0013E2AC01|nr:DUF805 domain-containing protein [Lacticaseibacillus hulanensis]